jgi:Ca2+-binding RTX toxin-like protein
LIGVEGVYGTAGDDTLVGDEADNGFWGGGGNDTIDGAAGVDTALYFNAPGPVTVDLAQGTASGALGDDGLTGIENVWGSSYDDSLTGDDGANFLRAGHGDDHLDGAGGDDELDGGAGADECVAGETLTDCEQ